MALAFFGIVAYTALKQSAGSGWEKVPQVEKEENLALKADSKGSTDTEKVALEI